MPPLDLVVTGVGALSAVGLSPAEVAASVRSATAMFSETAIMDRRFEPMVLAELPDDALPPLAESLADKGLTSREARMLRLAALPLRQALDALPPGAAPPPLLLALPDAETTRPLDANRFLDALAVQVPGFDRGRSDARFRGRAGGLVAVAYADQLLRAGSPYVVAGGVDTFRDLYVLGTLDLEQRLKSQANLDGFIPGEGAAFLLLASRATAGSNGARPLAAIPAIGGARETGHLYSEEPYRGDGLAQAIASLVGNGAPGPVREVYSSMNGESHWAKEWGVAFLRNRPGFDEDHGMHHPADCYGDTGAAAGPLMIALAALGLRDGYRRSPCLVYASSDRDQRAAVLVNSV